MACDMVWKSAVPLCSYSFCESLRFLPGTLHRSSVEITIDFILDSKDTYCLLVQQLLCFTANPFLEKLNVPSNSLSVTFCCFCYKISYKSIFKKEKVMLAHYLRVQTIMGKKQEQQEPSLREQTMSSLVKVKEQENECWCSTWILPFFFFFT